MKHTLLLMAAMALTTYLIRMLPFVVFRRKITSRFARSFLSYAPYAVLTAMTIPSVFTSTGNVITLPSIRTTIVIMLILKIGGMMSIGFEQPQMLKNAMVNDVGDVISTFIYRYGIQNAKHSISTAAGLLQSVINFALVITANGVSRKISDESIW